MRSKFFPIIGFLIFFVLIFSLLKFPTKAAEPSGINLDMEAIVNEALENNPAVHAARKEHQAAKLMVHPAGALPDPRLIIGLEAVPVDTFALNEIDMTQKIIGITQPLPFPGKLKLGRAVAESDAQSAGHKARIIENRTAYEIRSTFFEWALSEEDVRITQKNINVMDQFADVAMSNYTVGKSAQWDILQAQVQRAKLSERLITKKQEIESMRAMMAKLLGRDQPLLDGTPAVKWTPVMQLNEKELLKRADENNPELAYLRSLAGKADNSAQLARKERLPDFSFTLSYGFREDGKMNGVTQKRPDLMSAMLEVMLPLYSSRKQIPQVQAAQNMSLSARHMLEDGRLQIHAEIRNRMLSVRRADEIKELYRTSILPQTRTAVESALASYGVNKLDFLTLLTSQMNLFEHELDYYKVQINREIDFAALALLIGEQITPKNTGASAGGNESQVKK